MATSQIYIARDDGKGQNMGLGGGEWSSITSSTFFDGGMVWPDFAITDRTTTGSMSFSFQGTSVAFWGNTCPDANLQDFQVSFDDNPAYTTSTTDTTPQTYMQWYKSPLLPEGEHNMDVTGLRGEGVDLILISPGPNTPLAGETLMIDDSFPSIQYRGSGWKDVKDTRFKADGLNGVLPFQNGTHQTSNVGDSFSFSFTGSNLRLFGILPAQTGNIAFLYTVDDAPSVENKHSFTGLVGSTDLWNFPLLDTGPLSEGNHTVTVNLTAAIGQSLIVDYILYKPSFSTLAEMPNLPLPPSQTSSTVPSPTVSVTTPPSRSASASAVGTARQPKLRLGVVAGAAIGTVVGICLLTALFLFIRKRRKRRRPPSIQRWDPVVHPTHPSSPYHIEPFRSNHHDRQSRWTNSDGATLVSSPTVGYGVGLGKRGHVRKDSDTLPQRSPLPQTVTFTVAPAPAAQRRAELQLRLQELQQLLSQLEVQEAALMDPSSYDSDTGFIKPLPPIPSERSMDVERLRKDIEILSEEIARLAVIATPPPYAGEFV